MSDSNPQPLHGAAQLEADRRAKRARLAEQFHIDPYGHRVDGLIHLADARACYEKVADDAAKANPAEDRRPVVKVAGRVMLHRDIGKLVFMTLRDAGGDIQVAVSAKSVDDPTMQMAKMTDLGDIVYACGRLGTTKTGEITIWAASAAEEPGFKVMGKSLAPPPEKWHGLSDPELRYRKRYVDLYTNPEVMKTFELRSRIIKGVRDFLTSPPASIGQGFLEVETPMMQPIPGGAAARPFTTHHNALDMRLFMRIAPELYLKRLLVGGMGRVFEINRNFRNEGVDRSHNPEFTMLELYQAYGDLYSVMHLTETLIHHLATALCGADQLPYGELTLNFSLPFRRAKYLDLFAEHAGFPASDHAKLIELARKMHVENPEKLDHDLLLNEVWEEIVEPHLVQPTFVIDYPGSLCPLTKRKPQEPQIAERFELFAANMELANAYTELNDPDVQLANFQQQLAGEDDEAATFRNLDMDFIEALKVGMPPAGGLGVGIDRLVMLLTNSRTIRDVILFPLMRHQ